MNSTRRVLALAALTLAALLCFRPAAAAQVLSGRIANARNAHHYYLLPPSTWLEADGAARELGGHLVTIDDDAESQWVLARFGQDCRLWIDGPGRSMGPRDAGLPIRGVVEFEPVTSQAIVNPANNHSYYLLPPSTWVEAQAKAKAMALAMSGKTPVDVHLVTLDSIEERDFVMDQFGNYDSIHRLLWTSVPEHVLGLAQYGLPVCGVVEVEPAQGDASHPAREVPSMPAVTDRFGDRGDAAPRVALAPLGNPSNGSLRVSVALPDERPATLEVYDVAGREVASRRVGGRGSQSVTLADAMPAGFYVVRLLHQGGSLTTRITVVR